MAVVPEEVRMTAVTVGSDMLVSEWIPYDEEAVKSVTDILRDWDGLQYLKLTSSTEASAISIRPVCSM